MPNIGDTKLTEDGHRFGWFACLDCGKERWVQTHQGKPLFLRCLKCAPKHRKSTFGERSPRYIRGWTYTKDGYKYIRIYENNFFYPMATKCGRVLEHRLVMARSLGRCLQKWELVHHKNHNKSDNRIENLQLVSDDRHTQITILENKIKSLLKENNRLKTEITRLGGKL